jgi:hypothetical protein
LPAAGVGAQVEPGVAQQGPRVGHDDGRYPDPVFPRAVRCG